jgi:mycothiol synthase
MPTQPQPLVSTDDLQVVAESDLQRLQEAAGLLDTAEQATGSPLVDEAERDRLDRALRGRFEPSQDAWQPALAWRAGRLVGYLAVVADEGGLRGDAAVLEPDHADVEVLDALLRAARELAVHAAVPALQVWTRRAGEPQIETARAAGFGVSRRLGVLGRDLDDPLSPPRAVDATIRVFRPGHDDADVVAVLAGAYAGTDEAGWDLDAFTARTRLGWFRPQDLLVAERRGYQAGPRLGGLHWLKRRDATTGEVYNLAIHPEAQGEGLGPALLHAGLTHLRDQGLREVILWVDLDNERAVDLYTSQGFVTRWQDVAVGRAPTQ